MSRTERSAVLPIELVPVGLEHAENMARWMRDPEVIRGLGVRGEPTLETTRAWVERARGDETCHPFAIVADGAHVGNVVLDMVDAHLGTTRLSIYIGEADRRGSGVATAAVEMAAAVAQTQLGLHKLWLTVHTENAPAIAVYERCGFATEGVLRDEFLLDGRRVDARRMGLILAAAPA